MVVRAIDLHSSIDEYQVVCSNVDTPMDTVTDLLKVERAGSRRSGATCLFLDAAIDAIIMKS